LTKFYHKENEELEGIGYINLINVFSKMRLIKLSVKKTFYLYPSLSLCPSS